MDVPTQTVIYGALACLFIGCQAQLGQGVEHETGEVGKVTEIASTTGSIRSTVNPVLTGNHPDPHVLRTVDDQGDLIYYLVATGDNGGDIAAYSSRDLLSWELASPGLFGRSSTPGSSVEINGYHYCSIWAPQLIEVKASVFMLSFSAQRFDTAQSECPPYAEDGGVYQASASSALGPYALPSRPWEPLAAGARTSCPSDIAGSVPHSVDVASPSCQGTACADIIRLDSDVFRDPSDGRWWLSYSWYTNMPPQVDWEQTNHGEHVSVVELDSNDPFVVQCNENVAKVFVGNPHDENTLASLKKCPDCNDMLSMSKGRQGEDMMRNGYSWGINEGANIFRRGKYVYMLMNGSAWDSAYYHYFWVAAPSVEQLAYDSPNRRSGRLLVPSNDMSFGHGTVTLGPDGETLYLVHHRLRHDDCKKDNDCARDVWVTKIDFEDRGDGLGQVYPVPSFPAETPDVSVVIP